MYKTVLYGILLSGFISHAKPKDELHISDMKFNCNIGWNYGSMDLLNKDKVSSWGKGVSLWGYHTSFGAEYKYVGENNYGYIGLDISQGLIYKFGVFVGPFLEEEYEAYNKHKNISFADSSSSSAGLDLNTYIDIVYDGSGLKKDKLKFNMSPTQAGSLFVHNNEFAVKLGLTAKDMPIIFGTTFNAQSISTGFLNDLGSREYSYKFLSSNPQGKDSIHRAMDLVDPRAMTTELSIPWVGVYSEYRASKKGINIHIIPKCYISIFNDIDVKYTWRGRRSDIWRCWTKAIRAPSGRFDLSANLSTPIYGGIIGISIFSNIIFMKLDYRDKKDIIVDSDNAPLIVFANKTINIWDTNQSMAKNKFVYIPSIFTGVSISYSKEF